MRSLVFFVATIGLLSLAAVGCNNAMIFNPAFINQGSGEFFPLAPSERTGFILVRGNNSTNKAIEFLVTVERAVDTDDDGTTEIVTESYRLFTPANARANDMGVLIDCPIVRVGLGENLDRPSTDPGVFINAQAAGVGGLGVPCNMNPLSADAGNFSCGDTIVFQAVEANNTVGGIRVGSFVLAAEDLATEIVGIDTFANARTLMEEQAIDDD